MSWQTPVRLELPTEFDVGPVNSYLFPGPEPLLVDTGVDSPASREALLAGLAQHDLTLADVQRVIITHAHVDHMGAAAWLAAHSAAQIMIADLGLEWLINPVERWQKRLGYYRDAFLPQLGLPVEMQQMVLAYMTHTAETSAPVPPERVTTFQVGDWLPMGGRMWQVLHMPGHASHQTCFWEPESHHFISADMLLHKAPTPIVERPLPGQPRTPALPIFLQSLARVEALGVAVAYPGHGVEITDAQTVIQTQRQRIHQRKEETLLLLQQGAYTPYELVNTLYAHYPVQLRFAGMWMLIGYLDLLLAEGRAQMQVVDGVWHYGAA
jgi:glyoxylase-like metal-dependent hydrolase (beta-lactamase superfamily II)